MSAKTVNLIFVNEAAKGQDLSIPAVSGEALVFGQTYTVEAGLAAVLMQQGGWQPETATPETAEKASPGRKGGKAEPVTATEPEVEN